MSISAVVPFLSKLLQNLHASLFIYIHTQTNTLDPCARHMITYLHRSNYVLFVSDQLRVGGPAAPAIEKQMHGRVSQLKGYVGPAV